MDTSFENTVSGRWRYSLILDDKVTGKAELRNLIGEVEIARGGLTISNVQLLQDPVDMIFDSAHLDREPLCNLMIAKPLPDEG